MEKDYIIEILKNPTRQDLDALSDLMVQLDQTIPVPTADQIKAGLKSSNTIVLIARNSNDRKIIGTLTMVYYLLIEGFAKAWIEDVVVDSNARGRGVGKALMIEALELAKKKGLKMVSLTSRAEKKEAAAMYQKLGFEVYSTNCHRYHIKKD